MPSLRASKRLALPSFPARAPVLVRFPVALSSALNNGGTRFASSAPPSIASTSFWKSLIPKPLRSDARKTAIPKSKDWNPATFYIVIFLLIGSMSIQMISLRKNFEVFMRQSDVRIGLLREVIEKLQKGESVDVEAALGSGDPESEEQWEQVLREIEKGGKSQRPTAPEPTETGRQAPGTPEPGQARPSGSVTAEFY